MALYTSANLAVHLKHRGQAITGVEEWRVAVVETGWREIDTDALRDAGERAKGAIWLIRRLPEEHWRRPGFSGRYSERSTWLKWSIDSRLLTLEFESPHDVVFSRWIHGSLIDAGDFNLAMNIQEITDMVRWAVEGK